MKRRRLNKGNACISSKGSQFQPFHTILFPTFRCCSPFSINGTAGSFNGSSVSSKADVFLYFVCVFLIKQNTVPLFHYLQCVNCHLQPNLGLFNLQSMIGFCNCGNTVNLGPRLSKTNKRTSLDPNVPEWAKESLSVSGSFVTDGFSRMFDMSSRMIRCTGHAMTAGTSAFPNDTKEADELRRRIENFRRFFLSHHMDDKFLFAHG